jgi:hopanoid biosynthesis associated protein HpnK
MIVAVVNADDFGLAASINEGISVAYGQGILRSASLMANGEAFADAVARSKKFPSLGVGVHLSLVAERPITPAKALRGLVTDDGYLPASYADFTRGYLLRKFSLREIALEMEAQITRVLDAGIQPTHLDSHQHIHLLPGILNLTLNLAKNYHINVVRVPYDWTVLPLAFASRRKMQLAVLVLLSALVRKKVCRRGLRSAGSFHGLAASGHLDTQSLCAILSGLQHGVHEIMCHPGLETAALRQRYAWGYAWQAETAALGSPAVKHLVERRGISLRNFAEAWSTTPT